MLLAGLGALRTRGLAHRSGSRGSAAPPLRCSRYSCCMSTRPSDDCAFAFPGVPFPSFPRTRKAIFFTSVFRPSVRLSACPPSTGASSIALPPITLTCVSVYLFVAFICLRMSLLFRESVVTTDQWLVVTSLIDK